MTCVSREYKEKTRIKSLFEQQENAAYEITLPSPNLCDHA